MSISIVIDAVLIEPKDLSRFEGEGGPEGPTRDLI
jgi:hypothetical protein